MSSAATDNTNGGLPTTAGSSPHITKENIDRFDYFELFGLSLSVDGAANANIDVAAVRRIYRRLSLRFHPDKDDSAEARHAFEVVHTALETLIDAAKREVYIRGLNDAQGGGGGSGGGAKANSEEELRQRQRTQQAQEEAHWAAEQLQQREQQRRAKEEAARQAAQEQEAAAQRLLAELTSTLNTPFQQMEAELVREWDVDEEMVAMKTREVMKLLERLAPAAPFGEPLRGGAGDGSPDNGGTSRKRERDAVEGMCE